MKDLGKPSVRTEKIDETSAEDPGAIRAPGEGDSATPEESEPESDDAISPVEEVPEAASVEPLEDAEFVEPVTETLAETEET